MPKDSRLTTIVLWNSGLFKENAQEAKAFPEMNMPCFPKTDLQRLHVQLYFLLEEIWRATIDAADDLKWIKVVPAVLAQYDFSEKANGPDSLEGYGHYPATYREPNGGDFEVSGVTWLKWQLKGDKEAGKMFTGQKLGLTANKHLDTCKKKY